MQTLNTGKYQTQVTKEIHVNKQTNNKRNTGK